MLSSDSRRLIVRACQPVAKIPVEPLEHRRLLAGNGLQADYYNGKDFNSLALSRVDQTINFDWGAASPGAGVNSNFFSARWRGYVLSPTTGNYTFHTQSDDGIRLWINDQLVIDNWTDHASTENSGSAQLVANYPNTIRVEYFDGINDALARLSWSSTDVPKQVVPNNRLYTPDTNFVGPAPRMTLSLSINKLQMNELAADYADITLTRTGDLREPVTALLSHAGTATNGTDYILPGSITLLAGQSSASIRLTPIEDNLQEANETVIVSITPSSQFNIGQGSVATTIIDDDAPVPPLPGAYGGLKAEYFRGRNFESKLLERIDGPIAFDWGYGAPATGVPADNFSVRWTGMIEPVTTGLHTFYTTSDDGVRLWINGKLLIDQWNDHGPTEHSGTIELVEHVKYSIRMEYYDSGNGAVARLDWSAPGLQKTLVSEAQLLSMDVPAPMLPVVAITTSVNQATEGRDAFEYTLTRTGATDQPLAVRMSYGGTATQADIWASFPLTVTIPAGQSSITVSRYATADGLVEGREVIKPTIVADAAYQITGNGSVDLYIVDADAPVVGGGSGLNAAYYNGRGFTGTPAFQRTDATVNFDWGYNAPASGVGSDNFAVRWTGFVAPATTGEWTFYTTSDDGVRLWVNGQLLVDQWNDHAPAEHSGKTQLVAGNKYDIRMEYYEAGNGAVAQLRWSGPGVAKQVIPSDCLFTDVTVVPTVRIFANHQMKEGEGSMLFTLVVEGARQGPLTVDLGYEGTATAADFVGGLPASVTIPAGVSSYEVTVTPLDDGIIEENESLQPFIKPSARYVADNSAYRTLWVITSELDPPVVELVAVNNATHEGASPLKFGLIRRGDLTKTIVVPLKYSGTAAAGDFAQALPGSVTIPAGQTEVFVELQPIDEGIVEDEEQLIVATVAADGYLRGRSVEASLYIMEAIPVVSITTSDPVAHEDGDPAWFTVSRAKATDQSLRVALTYTGEADADDFVGGLPRTVTIPAGQESVSVRLVPSIMATDPGIEMLHIGIAEQPEYAVDAAARSVSISVTGDELPLASLNSYSGHVAGEGGKDVIIAAGLNSGNARQDVTVYLRYSGTATQDDFLDPLPISYTIHKGYSGVDLHLRVKDDTLIEGEEYLRVEIVPNLAYRLSNSSTRSYLVQDND